MKIVPRVCFLYRASYSKFEEVSDYDPLVYDFGEVLFKVDEDDYYGDSYVLYGNIFGNGKYGFLNFGWGSCPGCDALQACSSWEEVQELYDKLKDDVIWFDCIKDAYDWFINHDWKGDYSTPEKRKFIKIATAILEAILSEGKGEI